LWHTTLETFYAFVTVPSTHAYQQQPTKKKDENKENLIISPVRVKTFLNEAGKGKERKSSQDFNVSTNW